MSYRIMPPGSYHFWRFGMVSPLIRWAFTFTVCCVLIMVWYLINTRFLFKPASEQLWCAQCTAQLAELATSSDEELQASVTRPDDQPIFMLLQAAEKSGLVVQSSTSQKPTQKNNLTLQRINLTCMGTLEQCKLFLHTLAEGTVSLATIEMQLSKQQENLYKVTFSFETIALCA